MAAAQPNKLLVLCDHVAGTPSHAHSRCALIVSPGPSVGLLDYTDGSFTFYISDQYCPTTTAKQSNIALNPQHF